MEAEFATHPTVENAAAVTVAQPPVCPMKEIISDCNICDRLAAVYGDKHLITIQR